MTNDDHPSQPNRRQFLLTGGSAVAATVMAATVGDEPHAAQTAAGAAVPAVEGAVPITLRINSTDHSIRIDPRTTLLDCLRETLALNGYQEGL